MKKTVFRGKRRIDNTWAYGDLVHTDSSMHISDIDGTYFVAVKNETVGQYTGKTDKNGVEIFEGDIVRAMMDYGPAGWCERCIAIEWDDDNGYQWQYFNMTTIEVIGNKWDNPELLN